MKFIKLVFWTYLSSFLINSALAQTEASPSPFTLGTAAYSQGRLEEASSKFLEFLQSHPDDARAHLNLASIFTRQKNWPLAWAHFRKARSLDPSLSGISVLESILSENPLPGTGLSGPFHKWVRPHVANLNPAVLLLLLLVSATLYLHLLVRHLKVKKWARDAEEPPPQLGWSNHLLLLISVILFGATGLRYYLSTQTYASIVVKEGASLKSAPNEDSYQIAILGAGVEMKVLRKQDSWTQVSNESGTSGWLPNNSLLTYPGASR